MLENANSSSLLAVSRCNRNPQFLINMSPLVMFVETAHTFLDEGFRQTADCASADWPTPQYKLGGVNGAHISNGLLFPERYS